MPGRRRHRAGMFEPPESDRRMGDLLRQGVVCEVDGALCRVRFAEGFETDWIAMPMTRAGKLRVWSKFSEGERVLVACGDGDHESAAIVTALPSTAFPAPGTPNVIQGLVDDGAKFTYDPATHELVIDATATGKITLKAGGSELVIGPDGISFKSGSSQVAFGPTSISMKAAAVAFKRAT